MIKNPFRKDPPPTPEPTPQISNAELLDLQARQAHLAKRVGHLKKHQFNTEKEFEETKQKIQKELTKVSRRYAILLHEYDIQTQNEKIARTKAFLQQHIAHLVIEKDNTKLPIDRTNLSVTIHFSNCQHKKSFLLSDLVVFQNERLWQDIIKEGIAIRIDRSCQECIKEKQTLRKKGQWNDRPIGHAILTIRGLH